MDPFNRNLTVGMIVPIEPIQPIQATIMNELPREFNAEGRWVTMRHELPKEIIAEGQWVIADMDGTLIGAPGYQNEPNLDESVAKEAIFNWLRAGGHLLLVTGCETQRAVDRFTPFIPQDLDKALIERRLLLATNGGAVVSYFDGVRWTEDPNYQDSALEGRIAISKDNENILLANAVTMINDFYQELRDNPSRIPENLKGNYEAITEIACSKHAYDFTLEELDTLNSDIVPRIEIRRAETNEVVQICIIGIPTDINYDVSKLALDEIGNLDLCKVAVTHEINFKDVNKALPVGWLQKGQLDYPELDLEKSVVVGYRPNHNDAPLTSVDGAFVSVCEHNTPSYIPSHVTRRIGHNEAGTKQLLDKLLMKANEFNEANRLEPVIVFALDEVVKECESSFV